MGGWVGGERQSVIHGWVGGWVGKEGRTARRQECWSCQQRAPITERKRGTAQASESITRKWESASTNSRTAVQGGEEEEEEEEEVEEVEVGSFCTVCIRGEEEEQEPLEVLRRCWALAVCCWWCTALLLSTRAWVWWVGGWVGGWVERRFD